MNQRTYTIPNCCLYIYICACFYKNGPEVSYSTMDDTFLFMKFLHDMRVREQAEERLRFRHGMMEGMFAAGLADELRKNAESEEYVGKSQFSKDAEIPWGSTEGKKLRAEADDWKSKGTKAIGERKYDYAAALYSDGLVMAIKVCNNEDQIAVLCSNRSFCRCLMKDYEQAMQDAVMCFQTRPRWFKGPLRMMQCLKAQGIYTKAFDIGTEILVNFLKSRDDQIKVFTEVILMADVSGSWEYIQNLEVEREMWEDVIESLMKENEWHSMKVLLQDKDEMKPIVDFYDVNLLKLHKLLESCSEKDWKEWGQRFCVKVLQKGAKKEHLHKEGKYPLHSAFNVGMRTGTFELLKHLFLRYIPSADRDRFDEDGNTLLHLACSNIFLTKDTAIKLLLSHKLDPTLKNKTGKLPIELLKKGDVVNHKVLREDMEERGFNISSIKASAVPRPNVAQPDDASHPVSLPQGMGDGLSTLQEKQTNQTSLTASSCDLNSSQASRTQTLSAKSYLDLHPKTIIKGSSLAAYKWSSEDVKKWLKDEHLTEIKLPGLSGSQFTGALLVELKMMQNEAPEFFFHLLQDKLQIPFSHILKISGAIRNLS